MILCLAGRVRGERTGLKQNLQILSYLRNNIHDLMDVKDHDVLKGQVDKLPTAQTISRKLDPKIDFDFSYLDPPVRDEDTLNTL